MGKTDTTAPLFSAIIVTYNCGPWISGAVDSILAQTIDDLEIVVVDDGSTDDTAQVLEPYLDRIRYIRQENQGVAAARNTGVRESCGRIPVFLDADDAWEPTALEKVAAAFEAQPEVGYVSFTARAMDVDGNLTSRIIGKKSPGPFYNTKDLLGRDSGRASWFAVRREVKERVGPYDEVLRSAEDCDIALRLSFETRMMNLQEPLLRYRVRPGSLSRDGRLNARCWIRILEKLAKDRPEFVRDNGWAYRRALGKALLRLGRETLAHGERNPATWKEARSLLARSIRAYPPFVRAWIYWLWSVIAPSTYGYWRRREEKRRLARSR